MAFPVRTSASRSATSAITLLCLFAAITSQPAHAQTYTVLHNFTQGTDGSMPMAGLSMDAAGNLYGTTSAAGDPFCNNGYGCGTVFQLKHVGSGYVLNVLQTFNGPNGLVPVDRVVIGPDGAVYGTAEEGGQFGGGVVFRLTPPASFCRSVSCPWTETLLYQFQYSGDGAFPTSSVIFDPAGNIYGTTYFGGNMGVGCGDGCGVVYELARSGGGLTYNLLYTFLPDENGNRPYAGLTLDQAGNLYGTTSTGGLSYGFGTIFQLMPSGGTWQYNVLHRFVEADGTNPSAGVIFDQAGHLFGGTPNAGPNNCNGTIYELTPTSGIFSVLHCFAPNLGGTSGLVADLTMDSAGNLYGTVGNSSGGCGEVFKLTPQGGNWTYTTLHSFQGSDGCQPMSSVLMDSHGNLFGTTMKGGTRLGGVVWEITP